MNFLARVKLFNKYDIITDNLERESGTPPLTDIEGTTALLTDDGTSWEYIDGDWSRIDEDIDSIILNTFYPFLRSICESIHKDFIVGQLSSIYEGPTLYRDTDGGILISGLSSAPAFQAGDHVILVEFIKKYATGDTIDWQYCWEEQSLLASDLFGITLPDEPIDILNSHLTYVIESTSDSVKFYGDGIEPRITGVGSTYGLFFVSFPTQFFNLACSMLGYDLFKRGSKEKRQERLGNYTYTNFEPMQYYGTGTYPQEIEQKLKYWQKITI